jgi:hypothetical protein
MRMPFLEAMHIDPYLTTLNGSTRETFDPNYPASVSVANAGMSAHFNVSSDGNRLEGTVSNGFTNSPTVLLR